MTNQIVSPINISSTAPALPDPHVVRPHVVQTICQIFDAHTEVVCLDAPSGYGKTALLLEFANTVSEPCFGTFLRPASVPSQK